MTSYSACLRKSKGCSRHKGAFPALPVSLRRTSNGCEGRTGTSPGPKRRWAQSHTNSATGWWDSMFVDLLLSALRKGLHCTRRPSGPAASSQPDVTNACEFWSCDVTSDKCGGHSSQDGLASSDDWICQLKDAWESQTPSLTVRDSRATLKFQNGRESLTFDLHKAPLSEARKQVQELLFGLVVQVQKLEKRLEEGAVSPTAPSPLSSPKKDTLMGRSLFIPELSSTRGRAGSSTGQVASKRRLPGESLINPGFINKKTPTGVDFEDA